MNLASPEVCAPRLEENVARPRGGGRIGTSFLPLLGEFIPGLSREDEGAGAPHCAPGRATFPSVAVYASRFPYAMHTPSECGGFAPTGFELWRLTPTRAHSVILFRTTGWGIGDPGMDGRPFAG